VEEVCVGAPDAASKELEELEQSKAGLQDRFDLLGDAGSLSARIVIQLVL
jgi:hypothetical protein